MDDIKFHIRNIFVWIKTLSIPIPKDIAPSSISHTSTSEYNKNSVFFSPTTNSAEYVKVTEKTHLDIIRVLKDGTLLLKIAEKLWFDIVLPPQTNLACLSSSWGSKFDVVCLENIHKFLIFAKQALKRQNTDTESSADDVLFTPFDLFYEENVPKVLRCLSMLSLVFPQVPPSNVTLLSAEKANLPPDVQLDKMAPLWKGYKLSQEYDVLGPSVRKNVILEYYESEKQYIDALIVVEKAFMIPLSKRSDLTAPKDLATLFGNVKDLLTFHKAHLKTLAETLESTSRLSDAKVDLDAPQIGKIVLSMSQGFELYRIFCSNYFDALTLQSSLVHKTGFREFLEARNVATLQNFISIPYKRFLRYPLQVHSIVKCTPKEHPDYPLLAKSLQLVIKLTKELSGVKLKKRHAYLTSICKTRLKADKASLQFHELEMFTDDMVFKPAKLGFLIVDGWISLNQSEKSRQVMLLFEKGSILVNLQYISDAYSLSSTKTPEPIWTFIQSYPISGLDLTFSQNNTVNMSYESKQFEIKCFTDGFFHELNEVWKVMKSSRLSQVTVGSFKEKNSETLICALKYDLSPVENEIFTISDNLPSGLPTITDERLLFWSLMMLSDCGVMERSKSTSSDDNIEDVAVHDLKLEIVSHAITVPQTPTPVSPPAAPQEPDTSKIAVEKSASSISKLSQKSASTASPSIKPRKKFMDDSDSDNSDDESEEDVVIHDGLSIEQVKKNKKSRSKARAILGVGVTPAQTSRKPGQKRDQAIDERAVTGSPVSVESKPEKNPRNILDKLKSSGSLFKFGAEKEQPQQLSPATPPKDAPTIHKPLPQPKDRQPSVPSLPSQQSLAHRTMRTADSRSMISTDTSTTVDIIQSMEILDDRLLDRRRSNQVSNSTLDGRSSVRISKKNTATKEELKAVADSVLNFFPGGKDIAKGSNLSVNTSSDVISSKPGVTFIPVYMEDNSYRKVVATSKLTANDVIIQVLGKLGISSDESDFYNLYEEQMPEDKNVSSIQKSAGIRLMRDSNVMDLYDWWNQSHQAEKRILVLKKETKLNPTLDRRTKPTRAVSDLEEASDTFSISNSKSSVPSNPSTIHLPKIESLDEDVPMEWTEEDQEDFVIFLKHYADHPELKVALFDDKGEIQFVDTIVEETFPERFERRGDSEDSSSFMFPGLSPPPIEPPPRPPSEMMLIDPFENHTGAAENLEDSIIRIVKHIEPGSGERKRSQE